MFKNLLKRLKADPTPDPLEANDARVALAALLVRLAKIDHDYDASEIALIDQIVSQRFALSIDEASAVRQEAEEIEVTVGDTVHLTRLIKDAVPYVDRFALAVDLWRVVLADGSRDHTENSFLRLTVKLIGVNDVDSALARQQAAKHSV
ncbi:MAG: TerB family tellurite resistance protein [Rhodobacteraceae bacterium]|nr:TerB family tellurite resistance protein [Paracoccaceae bacterium]